MLKKQSRFETPTEAPVKEELVFTSFQQKPETLEQKGLGFINTHAGGVKI